MKHALTDLVAAELQRAGLPADPVLVQRLELYVRLLVRWGRRINLTGRPEPRAVIQRHLPDALALSALVSRPLVADIGAGAGLVGLLLPLLRPDLELQVYLVEPLGRRCSFLRTAAFELQLQQQVQILQTRLEQARLPLVHLACSRATWPPGQWLQRAQPLLAPQGEVAVFAASLSALPHAPPTGLVRCQEVSYSLVDGTPRLLVLYRRCFT